MEFVEALLKAHPQITSIVQNINPGHTSMVLGERETGTPVIVEDGVAKLEDRSSFAGSVATMDACFHTALRYGIPLCDAVKSCTLTPARIIGFDNRKGSLCAGKDADILIYDGSFNLKKVYVRGNEVDGVGKN